MNGVVEYSVELSLYTCKIMVFDGVFVVYTYRTFRKFTIYTTHSSTYTSEMFLDTLRFSTFVCYSRNIS